MDLLTGGTALDRRLADLIVRYDSFSFAVAWAGIGTAAYDALLKNQNKIRCAVIGTHFYQTHPQVLFNFIEFDALRFKLSSNEVFHPKAYLFRSGKKWELIIGSANFTQGGLCHNDELMLHTGSEDAEQSMCDKVEQQIRAYWNVAKVATTEISSSYKTLWEQKQVPLRNLASDYSTSEEAESKGRRKRQAKSPVESKIMSKSWDQYLNEVKADKLHGCETRCRLLTNARRAFSDEKHFSDLDEPTRRLLAGIPVKGEAQWGWFGSMKGAGYFKQAVINNDPHISGALDRIPTVGPVDQQHYTEFTEEFNRAFPHGGYGVAVASRLLAMKRPDYFLCLDSRNRRLLCEDFGIAQSGMNYRRFWDEVVRRTVDSPWWNAPIPNDPLDREIWLGRAAMLDAIYYEPRKEFPQRPNMPIEGSAQD